MELKSKIFRLSDSFSLYKSDFKEKKYYLFNVADGTIYRLNEVSYDMLSRFDGHQTFAEVLSEINSIYESNMDEIEGDFNSMLQQWLDKKILIERE